MQISFADIDRSFPRLIARLPGVPAGDGPLFVRRLIYGAGHRNLCIDDPAWKQIIFVVSEMDGRNDVLLEGQEAYPYLVVGGKDEKRLVAVGWEGGVCYLCDPSLREGKRFWIVLGGQPSEYEAELCVGSELAIAAIWTFVEQGTLLPSVLWVKDNLARDL